MGAVHNSTKNNLVTSGNQKLSITKSAGGNMMVMGDQAGQEYTHLYSPKGNTSVIYGSVGTALAQSSGVSLGSPTPDEKSKSEKDAKEHPWQPSTSSLDWPANFDKPDPSKCCSWSYNDGDKASQTYGTSFSFTNGDSYSSTKGNTWSQHWGNSFSMSMGASESFKLSNDFSASLSGSESFTLGLAKLDVSITGITYKTGFAIKTIDHTFGDLCKTRSSNESNEVGGDYTIEAGTEQEAPGFIKRQMLALQGVVGGITPTGPGKISLTAKDEISLTSTNKNISISANSSGAGANSTDADIDINAENNIQITGETKITISCGNSGIVIEPGGIKICSDNIQFGSAQFTESSPAKISQAEQDLAAANAAAKASYVSYMSAMSAGSLTPSQMQLGRINIAVDNKAAKDAQVKLDGLKPLLTIDSSGKTAKWETSSYTVTSSDSLSLKNGDASLALSATNSKLAYGAHSFTASAANSSTV
jgi:hypothetical protein